MPTRIVVCWAYLKGEIPVWDGAGGPLGRSPVFCSWIPEGHFRAAFVTHPWMRSLHRVTSHPKHVPSMLQKAVGHCPSFPWWWRTGFCGRCLLTRKMFSAYPNTCLGPFKYIKWITSSVGVCTHSLVVPHSSLRCLLVGCIHLKPLAVRKWSSVTTSTVFLVPHPPPPGYLWLP